MECGHAVLCESGVEQGALFIGMHVVSFTVELGCMGQSFGDGVIKGLQTDVTDIVPHHVCHTTSLDVGRVVSFVTSGFVQMRVLK